MLIWHSLEDGEDLAKNSKEDLPLKQEASTATKDYVVTRIQGIQEAGMVGRVQCN